MNIKNPMTTCRGVGAGVALALLSGCERPPDELSNAQRADRAFNAKVTVHMPQAVRTETRTPSGAEDAAQREKSQATRRESASTTSSNSKS